MLLLDRVNVKVPGFAPASAALASVVETLTVGMGLQVLVLIFIVVIIGGLGSIGGCLVGSLLVALVANYTAFLEPKIALVSNIALMLAVLLWRPQGLYPVVRS